ncbi:MAG: bifunctional UDP-3-O-[3-hydroxymyristoyl] N-acetylglucosamine deacetylase/3-hydroxyacyl-ACP dehydratase [Candidatus Omnitrophica bacterium]|nr:bifunctional UDP-3-O-[3-hydroxymyristoyl] N-acetylglucosamine deacetylase/3-hydroxyacyl-ACP dehydratase [Candidatus Omnitrophota bacterium]MBU2258782.1 bifunctional UDP-3-O-[3-hydroxymyristoyl] N-acetylglucosamine deacetylase/3-hydroxyacyl-ACP dehydratase [Candidatus Omnitrophota bacterium]
MDKQRTISREASLEGIGLHTGNQVSLKFKPAGEDKGISFVRVDLADHTAIKADYNSLVCKSGSLRCSSIVKDGVEVQTIEHLMAAFCGLGIDNIVVELNNIELPGMDGSSRDFFKALSDAGIKEQDKERKFYSIKEPIIVEEKSASIVILPAADLKISYTLNYNHSLLKEQFFELVVDDNTFKDEISLSRTFCLEEEAGELRDQGFGLGANFENTLVVGKSGVIKNKLRYPNEFARHKVLDLIGDLYLFGQPIKGHIIALRSGHSLNIKLLQKISQQRQKYASNSISIGNLSLNKQELDINDIMKILPHRQPFLFVDKIISLENGKRAVGLKNVTINDYFFEGHFPGKPVMPGVLVIEAMAQVGGVMMLACENNQGKIAFFMAIDNAKFRKPVLPGDQVMFEIEAVRVKSRTGQVKGKAFVDGKLVAEADLMFAFADS